MAIDPVTWKAAPPRALRPSLPYDGTSSNVRAFLRLDEVHQPPKLAAPNVEDIIFLEGEPADVSEAFSMEDAKTLVAGLESAAEHFFMGIGAAATAFTSNAHYIATLARYAFVTPDLSTAITRWWELPEQICHPDLTVDMPVLLTQQAEPSLLPAFDRIAEMAKLPANWDREDADPPTGSAVGAAAYLIEAVAEALHRLRGERVAPETSSPIPDGGLQVEWEGHNARIDVQINPDGSYGYLVKWDSGRDAKYEEADEAPVEKILGLIDRVFAY